MVSFGDQFINYWGKRSESLIGERKTNRRNILIAKLGIHFENCISSMILFYFIFPAQLRAFPGLWNVNVLHLNLQDFIGFWAQLCGLGGLRANLQTHLGLKHNPPFFFSPGAPEMLGLQVVFVYGVFW